LIFFAVLGLKSWVCTCLAGTLPLEPCIQPFLP
jgi:hypothetical protein